MTEQPQPAWEQMELPCACASMRRTARRVTQFYDEAMRPSGLRLSQFTLLQALRMAPGISQGALAELLGLDSTTLTRTLGQLRRKQWLRVERGEDRRALQLSLSAKGEKAYERVEPYWEAAQRGWRAGLGEKKWGQVRSALRAIDKVAVEGEGSVR